MFKIIVSLMLLSAPAVVSAQSNEHCASFLLKTLEHMKWDGVKGEGDILLAVVGDAALEQTIARKTVGLKIREKSVLVRPFTLAELGQYNMIYVANADSKTMHQIMSQCASLKTVVVTQDEGRLTEGSFIKLMPAGEKIRFSLDEKKFVDAGVMISPVIARLAVKGP